jgi:aminomethyltransferase
MSPSEPVKSTQFHDYHIEAGGKMVDFAGYSMPINYAGGIIEEHHHTRDAVGLFDVSHMGQVIIRGDNAAEQLEKLMPLDLQQLPVNKMTYTTLVNEQGGILDDLIVTRWDEQTFFVVVNASCKSQDIQHFRDNLPGTEILELKDQGLLALQGPLAIDVLVELAPEVADLHFMQGCSINIHDCRCYVTRSGYTGEDGFEISITPADCPLVVDALLANPSVRWVGLGARDSLRLESGLCLYGHDMNQQTSPVEANLLWSISKSRRTGGFKEGGFLGAQRVLKHIDQGIARQRVGFIVEGRAPVREGAEIIDNAGDVIGVITSGGFSPSLQKPIAMGYVDIDYSTTGTKVNAMVRGKSRPLIVSPMPFVPQRYYRG